MYEAKQNKEKVSRRIDSGGVKQCREILRGNIYNIFLHTSKQSTYPRTKQILTNRIIQRRFVVASSSSQSTHYETYESALNNISPFIGSIVEDCFQGIIGEDDVMSFLKTLTDSKTPLPNYFPVTNVPMSMYKNTEDKEGIIYKQVYMQEFVSVFKNYDDLIQYLINFIALHFREGNNEVAYNNEDKSTIEPISQSYFYALYNRYPTIYTYGMNTGGQIATNKQGPHTLSHVSINYLMDNAPANYNFEQQILNIDGVKAILNDLGILPKTESNEILKVDRYLEEYQQKTINYEAEKESGKTLARELMEMHPMAVYGWFGNIRQNLFDKPIAAKHKALAGKGERYCETIFFDLSSKRMGRTQYRTNFNNQLVNYLALRLSMSVKPEKIDHIVNILFNEGKYTLQKEDLLRYVE